MELFLQAPAEQANSCSLADLGQPILLNAIALCANRPNAFSLGIATQLPSTSRPQVKRVGRLDALVSIAGSRLTPRPDPKYRAILEFYEIHSRTFKRYCFICLSSGGTLAVHNEPLGLRRAMSGAFRRAACRLFSHMKRCVTMGSLSTPPQAAKLANPGIEADVAKDLQNGSLSYSADLSILEDAA